MQQESNRQAKCFELNLLMRKTFTLDGQLKPAGGQNLPYNSLAQYLALNVTPTMNSLKGTWIKSY